MSEGRAIQVGSARASAASRMRAAVVLALASLPAVVQGFVVQPHTTRGGAMIGSARLSQVWEAGRKPEGIRGGTSRATRPGGRSEITMGDRTMPICVRRGTARGAGGSFPSLRAVVSASMPGFVRVSKSVDAATSSSDLPAALPYLRESVAGGMESLVKGSQVCHILSCLFPKQSTFFFYAHFC